MVRDDLLTLYQMVSQAHLRRLHMDMLRRVMWFEVQYNVVTAAQMRMSEALFAQLMPYWQGEPLPKAQHQMLTSTYPIDPNDHASYFELIQWLELYNGQTLESSPSQMRIYGAAICGDLFDLHGDQMPQIHEYIEVDALFDVEYQWMFERLYWLADHEDAWTVDASTCPNTAKIQYNQWFAWQDLLKKQWDLPKNQRTRFIAQVGEYEYQSWLCTIPELNIKWAKTKGPPFLNHHDHHEWDDLLDWQHAVVHVSNRKDPHLFTMLEQAP